MTPEQHAAILDDLVKLYRETAEGPTRETDSMAAAVVTEVLASFANAAEAGAAALRRETWRPIATAPKDGLFIVHEDTAIRIMYRNRGEWQATALALDQWGAATTTYKVRETGVYEPTHWMTLPAPPEAR